MHIYLTGTHSTGKSSVAKILAEEYGWLLVDGVARSMGKEFSKAPSPEQQREFMHKMLNLQQQYSEVDAVFSRCPFIDPFAYYFYYLSKDPSFYISKIFALYAVGVASAPENSLIFYFPPREELYEDDGVRPSFEAALKVDSFIKTLLDLSHFFFAPPYYTLTGNTVEERVNEILTYIKEVKK